MKKTSKKKQKERQKAYEDYENALSASLNLGHVAFNVDSEKYKEWVQMCEKIRNEVVRTEKIWKSFQ